jgi:hypothetical protein
MLLSYLPDKAIELVDKAGARMQIPCLSMGPDRKSGEMRYEAKTDKAMDYDEVTEFTIAQVLSNKIGVPIEIISGHLEGTAGSRLLLVQIPLSNMILSGELKELNSWQVVCSDKGISFKPQILSA